MFALPGFTNAASGTEQGSMEALRKANETSYFRSGDTLWVKLVATKRSVADCSSNGYASQYCGQQIGAEASPETRNATATCRSRRCAGANRSLPGERSGRCGQEEVGPIAGGDRPWTPTPDRRPVEGLLDALVEQVVLVLLGGVAAERAVLMANGFAFGLLDLGLVVGAAGWRMDGRRQPRPPGWRTLCTMSGLLVVRLQWRGLHVPPRRATWPAGRSTRRTPGPAEQGGTVGLAFLGGRIIRRCSPKAAGLR